ncbi:uncharacterized protein STEHIDRAFT_141882 [Stereum hirsutum FP-91666 SS1]|uniref:uncharacterized protein n=1 Tax=Stereum hirsutum (strain FP-91666) TaxID=721885 RepID=UPI00044493FD|nr:uncharacterized protein STEHIDRAFT_141882 [Stereum hirsutum FP-91666 SS1]EIM81905.1 hypothetical protein STEHIDRAFT_141882 [Stereum hirsutum FP-91666 SS1]
MASKSIASFNGLYAGNYLAGVLYGLTTHQTYVYFRSNKDRWSTRLLVLALWILDTLHAVFLAVGLRHLIEEATYQPVALLTDKIPWTLSASMFIMSVSDSGVRGFYCYRIWKLSEKNWILTSVAAVPVVCALIAGLYVICKIAGATGLQALNTAASAAMDATLISISVADITLAGFLCILLMKSRAGGHRTNSIISTLILYTVTTGFLTSVVAIASLILIFAVRETYVYTGPFFVLSKLYFSSLLATLNRRDEISTQLKGDDEVAILPVSGTVRNGHGQSRGGVQPRCEQHRPEVSQSLGSVLDIKNHAMIKEGSDHVSDPRTDVNEYNYQIAGTSGTYDPYT